MKNITSVKQKFISEALVIASAPFWGYLITRTYYSSIGEKLGIDQRLWDKNFFLAAGIGVAILLISLFLYWISECISRTVPPYGESPIVVRIKRIIQVSLFLTLGLLLPSFQRHFKLTSSWILTSVLILAAVLAVFTVREFLFDLVKYRKEKGFSKRLSIARENEEYTNAGRYYGGFLKPTSIGLLFIPLVIVLNIVSQAGKNYADFSTPRSYIIVNTNPKRIVLVDYGDKWLAAIYDDRYPGKPAYRKDYKIINVSDFGTTSFEVKHLDMLYVYD
jgi:hypothetical protein